MALVNQRHAAAAGSKATVRDRRNSSDPVQSSKGCEHYCGAPRGQRGGQGDHEREAQCNDYRAHAGFAIFGM